MNGTHLQILCCTSAPRKPRSRLWLAVFRIELRLTDRLRRAVVECGAAESDALCLARLYWFTIILFTIILRSALHILYIHTTYYILHTTYYILQKVSREAQHLLDPLFSLHSLLLLTLHSRTRFCFQFNLFVCFFRF